MQIAAVLCLLALGGCGTAPAWEPLAVGLLSYLASANNLGAESLKVWAEEHPAQCGPAAPLSSPEPAGQ